MMKLQNYFNKLKPYFVGLRYVNNDIPVVDVMFKKDWVTPKSKIFGIQKNDNVDNYYMIYPLNQGIELDDLFLYVEEIIRINLEIEQKNLLLNKKIIELKEIFKSNPLSVLENLKFVFENEINCTTINESDNNSDNNNDDDNNIEEQI